MIERCSPAFFMEILIGGCCSLWEQRNDAIFNTNIDPAKAFSLFDYA
jgi:hypothetical protein